VTLDHLANYSGLDPHERGHARRNSLTQSPYAEVCRHGYRRGMRFIWAALAVLPFAVVLVGMLTGRVRARSCCAVPAGLDTRLRAAAEDPGVPR
jgi:hypothetical protein